ncbi:glycoside hydrolase family 5 protein [Serendipita vermifera MAFF 305830]|uniref:Glycoside hydrolase family 5 protein n=1 Tax=Serendipita vermifera MAFF 305830 TaxID=933852 RepID=A0A0C2WH76_SERVB|nr:glycoside hydrolase family 5 protein [Serendipita vermifera MAFF 305830]
METPVSSSSLAESFVIVDGNNPNKASKPSSSLKQQATLRADTPRAATVTPPAKSPVEISSYAHDWSHNATGGGLSVHGRHFVDGYGRVCLPRGVNLSGSCKSPLNENPAEFWSRKEMVTFVGRPFPLKDAHEHLARLRRWGLTFVRFLITWEAIEHRGPGQHDHAYLKYLKDVITLLPQYGMIAMVSMHQDVWSRFSGGSGAPAWTLEAVGFNLENLEVTGAVWLDGVRDKKLVERGVWPTGYQKLAAATMATCFWAGDTFAPKLIVDGQPIQQYLQEKFLKSWQLVAETVGGLEAVVGFDMMNEPHRGYIDLPSLHGWDYNTDLHLSYIPSAFNSFTLGAGHPTPVAHYIRSFPMPTKLDKHVMFNEAKLSAWRPDGPTGGKCLWEMHGVWGYDEKYKTSIVLREHYFNRHPLSGEKIDWYTDFYYPFLAKWSEIVKRASSLPKLVFVEPIPNEFCPASWTKEKQIPQMVFSPHWYDLDALFRKEFGNFTVNVQALSRGKFPPSTFYWGHHSVRRNYGLQIKNIAEAAYRSLGERPVFMGETGVPMDMNNAEAFRSGDFTWQSKMMDALCCALEQTLIGFTLWNYNPLNEDSTGDQWNGENFSWFSNARARKPGSASRDQIEPSLDDGGRILESVVRPYPAKVAGIPLKFDYDINRGEFRFEWAKPETSTNSGSPKHPSVNRPPLFGHPAITSRMTELYVPMQLVKGRKIVVALDGAAQGSKWWYEASTQTLFVEQPDPSTIAEGAKFKMIFGLTPPPAAKWSATTHWEDFAAYYSGLLAVLLALLAYMWL